MRTITLREVATGDNRREGPTKRLSDAEFQARREKGLCFRCGEKYFAGHRCKSKEHKELRMLVVREGGEELEIVEEEFFDAETEMKQVEVQNVENLNIELSLNSVVGLTNPGIMKVKGRVGEEEVVILIDCGATHNFIAEKLVTKLGLTLQETPNYGVILGSGTAVKGKGVCRDVEVQLEGWKVVIKGDPSLTKTRVSLKNLMKSWGADDQGFLVECRTIECGLLEEHEQDRGQGREDEEAIGPLSYLRIIGGIRRNMKPMRGKQVAGKVVAMKPIPRRHVGDGKKARRMGTRKGDPHLERMIDTIRHNKGLYLLDDDASSSTISRTSLLSSYFTTFEKDLILWHFHLGHPNFKYMKYLFPHLFFKVDVSSLSCDVCIQAKHHQVSFPSQPCKPTRSFTLVHSDVWRPSKDTTSSGKRWFVTFTDDHTRLTWVFLISEKFKVTSIFWDFHHTIETQFDSKIAILQSDNGREFQNHSLNEFLSSKDIVYQSSCACAPNKMG
ncbi:Beta-galactosidase [Cucumis melo var. makuwa]|uniref:Beta-galactosidase n=1 Tax=Cucumis melo var. makuwa TaxID=1194695 RepID=A0A5D3DL54_CUCMM|nr:Beta-galactosidase [Cucumis melo var. makuwa]TYK24355.1 Beta-galactosidase [Cucumis melo var. makuwa]